MCEITKKTATSDSSLDPTTEYITHLARYSMIFDKSSSVTSRAGVVPAGHGVWIRLPVGYLKYKSIIIYGQQWGVD